MKVSIIGGGGVVGSSAAFVIAREGNASEIVLVDARSNVAEAHALDIEQAVSPMSRTIIRGGDIEDTQDSDIIVMTAGVPHKFNKASRSDFLAENLPIIVDLASKITELSPSALWITASIPVDPLVYLIHRKFSIPREKSLGLNFNDTVRFRWAIARVLSVPANDVSAFVLGEHGESQVPLYSKIEVKGEPIRLNSDQEAQVREEISGFFSKWIKLAPGRTAGWLSAESIGGIVASIAKEDEKVWACSTPAAGEYGFFQASLGLPVRLCRGGVKEIIELDLSPEEKGALENSCRILKAQIKEGEALL